MNLRDMAHTRRCHTVQTIGHQTVAEHSYHVALLCVELCNGVPSMELLKAALYHDLPEVHTGDIPATAKWANKDLCKALIDTELEFAETHNIAVPLTNEEVLTLKWADALELGFYCCDQRSMGNKHVEQMYTNIYNHMVQLPQVPKAYGLMKKLQQRWADAIH